MDRNLALEFVRVTEAAALGAAKWMGLGNDKAADQAAVDYMRKAFSAITFDGTVVIGEGERDEAPMLYIGEKIGKGEGPKLDIAIDPLEGTTLTAQGRANAISVVAAAPRGHFLNAPDTYMKKIAVGPGAAGAIDINAPVKDNVRAVAKKLCRDVDKITVVILDRPRHADIIREVREAGARICLIQDGDVAAAVATAFPRDSEIDLLLGIGGAPEGVLAAAALQCLGGDMQGQLKPRNDEEVQRAHQMGVKNIDKVFTINELARGDDIMFAATGVTNGSFLKGVRLTADGAMTHSVVMRSKTGTIRYIEAHHKFAKKPVY
ncbi:MAG: class II fructose-bisphosphatase [Planctomycetes bacterium]|nr:class II fructose-bisphosphatase [Planctomycetota bacterium]